MKDLKSTLRFNYPKKWNGGVKGNQYFLGFTDMLTHELNKMIPNIWKIE